LKLGIIGLPGSGKSTVFRALTGVVDSSDTRSRHEGGVGVVKVEDARLHFLAEHHKPKKVTPVHVQYSDIAGITGEGKSGRTIGDKVLALIRPLDALVHCVRFFDSSRVGALEPVKDFRAAEEEIVLSDLSTVEKRLDRAERDFRKGKKELSDELELLKQAKSSLEEGKTLRYLPSVSESEKLRGFAFLSAKPELVLVNAGELKRPQDIQQAVEQLRWEVREQPRVAVDWLYADTEAEIARLSPEEAREFLEDLALEQGAKDRIIRTSFELLNLIVFFTVSEPELRAWPLEKGNTALKAAGTVHTDMERGFIRAEVVAFDDFQQAGSMPAAHKAGKVRLEGRDYVVRDGDIIYFRFNV
jgi:GTP-binding protein YchF